MPSHLKLIVPQPNNRDIPPGVEVAVAPLPDPETRFEKLDRLAHAHLAQATMGIAPSVMAEAWIDWAVHLASSPGKQMELVQRAVTDAQSLWSNCLGLTTAQVPDDRRFASGGWNVYPFNVLAHAYHRNWELWQDAMTGVHGVSRHTKT